jgi:hypothetical protein
MVGLLIVAACCTLGFIVEVVRLFHLEVRSVQRSLFLRREARRAHTSLDTWRRLHAHRPCRETRRYVAYGEALVDLIQAVRDEDWEKAALFTYQVKLLDTLISLPVEDSALEPWHADLVRMAAYN